MEENRLTLRMAEMARNICGAGRPAILFTGTIDDQLLRTLAGLPPDFPARPALLGNGKTLEERAESLGIDAKNVLIVDPQSGEDIRAFTARLLEIRRRRGLTPVSARSLVTGRGLVYGLMALRMGRVDGLVAGPGSLPAEDLDWILTLLGPAPPEKPVYGFSLLHFRDRLVLAADTLIHTAPGPERLVGTALHAADFALSLGIDPRVALISDSDFGSRPGVEAETMRKAAEMIKARRPDLPVDGEMNLATALDPRRVETLHPHARIRGDATVLIFPGAGSATLACQAAACAGGAEVRGPYLAGLEHPANLFPDLPDEHDIIAVTAITAAQAGR